VKLFLDANVLFTAARTPLGKAALIIDVAADGHWELLTSAYAIEEARRNLERKAPTTLARFADLLRDVNIVIPSLVAPCPKSLPLKDRPIFQAAHSGGASHLLTGDLKDFGPLMNRPDLTFGIIVQTVAEFLAAIR
jgi:predicted nucleic acid-binding protein